MNFRQLMAYESGQFSGLFIIKYKFLKIALAYIIQLFLLLFNTRLKPLPFFSPLIAFARKLQMENQLYSASLPVEYIINYPERLSNIKESSEEVDGVLQRQSFKHIVNARDINENPDDNNDGNDKEETNIPIIPPFILKRRTRRFN